MLNVQEYLMSGKTLNDLTEEFGIKVKLYDDRVLLNYNQIESDKNNPIACECRGLVLSYPDFNVLCKGYTRFLNLTENGYMGPSNWDDWSVMEKSDGTCIFMYHDGTQWQISTRGAAFGESTMAGATFKYMGRDNVTYREGVLFTIKCSEEEFQIWADAVLGRENTYCFEFVGPMNKHTTPYEKNVLIIHGIFNKDSFEFDQVEYDRWVYDMQLMEQCGFNDYIIRPAYEYKCSSMDDMQKLMDNITGLEEGFVCVNKNPSNGEPHRFKLKHPTYLVASRLKGNDQQLSLTSAIELFLDDGGAEFLTYYPEDKPIIDQVSDAFNRLMFDMNMMYRHTYTIELQKDFALEVAPTPYSAILFQCRAKKCLPAVAWESAKDSLKVKLIELYWNKLNAK